MDPMDPMAIRQDTLLARLFHQEDGPPRSLCNGLGRCGRCRVRFRTNPPAPVPAETQVFSDKELADGWRLACRHPDSPASIRDLDIPKALDVGEAVWNVSPAASEPVPCCLALDLGTTTLDWRLVTDGRVLAHGRSLNPQGVMGAEVMSRLACAADSRCAARLRHLPREFLQALIREAALRGLAPDRACVAGNTVMTSLLLGRDTAGLAAAPYRLEHPGGCEERLPGLPPVYIPPLAGPFLGADLTAGLAWLVRIRRTAFPFLLMDLGTNGECILALDEHNFLATSVAMGPALEGVGLSCGRLAGPDVATAVRLTPRGLRWLDWQGRALEHPEALSGTGALGLVHVLLQTGVLTEDGHFAKDARHPLAERLLEDVCVLRGEPVFCLDEFGSVRLTATDIEQLLKVKAACNAATTVLLQDAGLTWADLAAVCLAGALGRHLEPGVLEGTGWLPATVMQRPGVVQAVGNSSLEGAALLCEDAAAREWIQAASARIQVRNLAELPTFQQLFLERMTFRHVFRHR
ncbi:ASKHA domain-containing protein [Megalodesulfovibrio gigas]|uniref:Putative ferredoxin n=1 Tax=Megalodesulfovibrio gigas (strain ATCC 19364 / DSM 1382 / NCIMB 9332 / VKM B-1759) TaxID=1121448 RepID=T2GF39_MEGG1|nr:ASKHA domain-containing protein [Megalodesulfovibrio gigas]AGW14789.1 putative ferredoxin [Megalodesulfovibrio gigas DSM 1382 = ATCC 19364]